MRPYLRSHVPQGLEEIPEATVWEAGYLVTKNAGWRSVRPVIDTQRCVGCRQCYLYCPDGVIHMQERKAEVDYDFCKGCGICERMCKPGAISLVQEKS